MRASHRRRLLPLGSFLAASLVVQGIVPIAVGTGAASAQTKSPDQNKAADQAKPIDQSKSPDQAKSADSDTPAKQITLTQQKIDGLIAARKSIAELESKQPKDKDGKDAAPAADAKLDAQIAGIVKSSGFASMDEFADTNYSIGIVLSGLDGDTGNYIGADASLKKQIAEVQADKKMPPNEKKEALDELNETMKSAPNDKPLPGNVELVKANLKKLSEGTQSAE